MRRSPLVLAGVIAFDLGVVVVSSHAAPNAGAAYPLKLKIPYEIQDSLKANPGEGRRACKAAGGEVLEKDGKTFCQAPAKAPVKPSASR